MLRKQSNKSQLLFTLAIQKIAFFPKLIIELMRIHDNDLILLKDKQWGQKQYIVGMWTRQAGKKVLAQILNLSLEQ